MFDLLLEPLSPPIYNCTIPQSHPHIPLSPYPTPPSSLLPPILTHSHFSNPNPNPTQPIINPNPTQPSATHEPTTQHSTAQPNKEPSNNPKRPGVSTRGTLSVPLGWGLSSQGCLDVLPSPRGICHRRVLATAASRPVPPPRPPATARSPCHPTLKSTS